MDLFFSSGVYFSKPLSLLSIFFTDGSHCPDPTPFHRRVQGSLGRKGRVYCLKSWNAAIFLVTLC